MLSQMYTLTLLDIFPFTKYPNKLFSYNLSYLNFNLKHTMNISQMRGKLDLKYPCDQDISRISRNLDAKYYKTVAKNRRLSLTQVVVEYELRKTKKPSGDQKVNLIRKTMILTTPHSILHIILETISPFFYIDN